MKKLFSLFIFIFFLLQCAQKPVEETRVEIDMNFDWKFYKSNIDEKRAGSFETQNWQDVNLPHDWMIDGPISQELPSGVAGGFFPGGIGYYQKEFELSPETAGKKIFLVFDGIYYNSTVWINNKWVGHQHYGYVSHYYDITKFVRFDAPNSINIEVDATEQPNDRWYSGAGIFRDVRMIITAPVHVPIWGTYITTTELSDKEALVNVETQIQNGSGSYQIAQVQTSIFNPAGKVVSSIEGETPVPLNAMVPMMQELVVKSPTLWSPETPALYKAVTRISIADSVVDEVETPFGIRSVAFTADSGFVLNGKKVVLKGVCLHHEAGAVGAAVPAGVWERRLNILKKMGVNALRLAHNPHAPEILDMADRMGFVVYDEMYDKWNARSKDNPQKTEQAFLDTYKKDMSNFINRDKNHPSVIIWSVGNEVEQQLNDPERGVEILQDLVEQVKRIDPSREVTCALHPANAEDGHEVPSRFIHHMDVVSYNYRTKEMATEWRQRYPRYKWIATETKAYRTDAPPNWADVDYSNNSWFYVKDFIAGQFIWAGFDYLGESRGWPDKGIRSGIIYTTGFRKPHSWFTESIYSDAPMVHAVVLDDSLLQALTSVDTWMDSWYGPPVSDHWSFPEKQGTITQVLTYTNCESVELLLNGKSLGEKQLADYDDLVIRWQVPYETGELVAVGKQGGQEKSRHVLTTAGPAQQIQVVVDKSSLNADGKDVAHVEIRIVDENGVLVPRAANLVEVNVSGAGKLIGLDNGDMADHSHPLDPQREAYGGRLLAIVQSARTAGEMTVRISSDNLESAELKLTVQ